MRFEVVGTVGNVETIATGPAVRVRSLLNKVYGRAGWRKIEGTATVRLPNGVLRSVELRGYEADGLGRRDLKIKRYLDE